MKNVSSTVVVVVLGLVACSGCSSSPPSQSSPTRPSTITGTSPGGLRTLADLQKKMARAGVTCQGKPTPYLKKKDSISFGPAPIEQLKCTIDGRAVMASRWKTQDQRKLTMSFGSGLLCGLSPNIHHAAWIASSSWVVSTGEMSSADLALVKRIGTALGVTPSNIDCDAYREKLNGPTAGADKTGKIGLPAKLGGGTSITLNKPRVDGDKVGPWIDVDFTITNHSSTATTMPDVTVLCGYGPAHRGSFMLSLSEDTAHASTTKVDAPIKPGASLTGTLELRQPPVARDNGLFPICPAPAAFQVGDEGPAIPLSSELLAAWNAAAAKARAGS